MRYSPDAYVYWAIDHHGRHHPGIAQAGNERCCFPMAMGDAGPKSLAPQAATMAACHVGAGLGLVD
jgi:hypothetical protein